MNTNSTGFEEMSCEEMLSELARLVAEMDENDLDLLTSCKRQSSQAALLRGGILFMMDGGASDANKDVVQEFMDAAVKANHDSREEPCHEFLALRQSILESVSTAAAGKEALVAVS